MTSPENLNYRSAEVPPVARVNMTADNRRTPRKQLKQFLTVVDVGTKAELGRMVDISPIGMMLIGSSPLMVHQEYLLDILLPAPGTYLRLRATCQWSRSGTTNTAHHGSGFRFDGVGAEQRRQIDKLILAEKPS